jgi:hypothetical protein
VYINIARELYSNIFLFNKEVQPLVFQQNRSEIMKCIKESILNAVRDSIPVDKLLRAYLDETTDLLKEEKVKVKEEEDKEKEKEEVKENKEPKNLSFSDKDSAITVDNHHETIDAPKDINRLEELSVIRNQERKEQEALEAAEEEEEKIKFMEDSTPVSIDTVSLDPIELSPIQIDIEELK